jgi:DNA-directed RNA polymerase subunit F
MPRRVDDALEVYRKVCRALGYDVEDEREIPREFVPLIDALVKIWEPGHRHYLALWLSGYLRKLGWSQKVVEAVLEEIADRANDRELKDRLRALEDTYSKDPEDIAGSSRLREELQAIVGPEEAEKIMNLIPRREPEVRVIDARVDEPSKPKLKVREVLSFVFPDGRVAEAIGIRNALGKYDPALLILGSEGFRIESEVFVGDVVLRGADPRTYPYEPYVVEDLENVKSRAELVKEIYAEVKRFIDVSEEEKAIFTAYILMSYCPELFETVPYLYLVGDNASGKSHTLHLFAYLCYRPLYGVSIPPADIYSYLGEDEDDPPLTIIEDEFQGSDRDTEKMKIYKAGYQRGARVPRIAIDQNGRRRKEFFNAFGPKIVAAEELIENKGFLERCIVIEMVEGMPERDHYDREDKARFARLRAELLKWRMAVLAGREKLPELELEWLKRRDRELYLPLLTVLEGTPLYSILEEYIREEIKRKREEKRGSLEAQVAAVVLELAKGFGAEIPFPRIWDRLKERLGAVSSNPSVVIETAMDTEVYGRITKNKVGAILRDKLGLERVKTHRDGKPVVLYRITDSEKFRRTAIKYGLEDPLPISSLNIAGSE